MQTNSKEILIKKEQYLNQKIRALILKNQSNRFMF
tara:strand:- start:1357 stop:1461 length:105 start_codon:yes stop_codon:yes gene_type:complete